MLLFSSRNCSSSSSSSSSTLLFVLLVLIWCTDDVIVAVHAHSRWRCPAPRNPSTGIKTGPCGAETNDFSADEPLIEIQPGPLNVIFEESISHRGSPFRIALSGNYTDDDEASVCVLLDHIPHNDDPQPQRPNIRDPDSYTQYAITIEIPDVACERCSLHLGNPMTDKIGVDGAPGGVGCTDPGGSCFSVYHSCTVPFKISGNTPRDEYACPPQATDWPTDWIGDDGVPVDASVPGVYRRETGIWSVDGLLQGVPERYRRVFLNGEAGICSSNTAAEEKTTAGPTTTTTATTTANESEAASEQEAMYDPTEEDEMENQNVNLAKEATIQNSATSSSSSATTNGECFRVLIIAVSCLLLMYEQK